MPTEPKSSWRAGLRAARRGMDDDDRRAAGERLAAAGLAWARDLASAVTVGDAVPGAGRGAGRGAGDSGTAGTATDPASGAASVTVCAFVSYGVEPPTGPLLHTLAAAGYRVAVPVAEPAFQLSWVHWQTGTALAPSTLTPALEPVGERHTFAHLGPVAGILVPALAADLGGIRLGQGGGYYDRFLSAVGAVPRVAVVYESEVFPAGTLPADELDQPMDGILSPSGLRPVTS